MVGHILGALGWLGAILIGGAVVIRFARPEWQDARYWLSMSGLVCVVLYMLAQWREVFRAFGRRQIRYASLAAASTAAVLGILIAVNYIAARQNRRWDLTAAKQFTLSDQTVRILESLTAPVEILVFARDDDFGRFRDRLGEFEQISDLVSVRYIDIDKEPVQARQYQIQSYGTVVVDYEGRVERVVGDTEQQLTNTLIKAITGEEQVVYFVSGHGEKNVRSAEHDGYNGVSDALARDHFRVETLVLAQQPDLPTDASVVVVAGPRTDLFPAEVEALRRHLNRGGKALFLLDPPDVVDPAPLTNLSELLAEWAITLGTDVVVDVSGMGQLIGTDVSVPVAASYPTHAITEQFSFLTAFPLARSVSPVSGGVGDRVAEAFVETSERSWAEMDIARLSESGEVELEEDQGDRPGPIAIAVAVSAPAPEPGVISDQNGQLGSDAAEEATRETETAIEGDAEAGTAGAADASDDAPQETRVAVVGDSDFVANANLRIQGNRDLFLNTVNWLAQQENLVAIRPREPEDRRITLTLDEQQRIFWFSILWLPGMVLGTGIYTWWRRRQ